MTDGNARLSLKSIVDPHSTNETHGIARNNGPFKNGMSLLIGHGGPREVHRCTMWLTCQNKGAGLPAYVFKNKPLSYNLLPVLYVLEAVSFLMNFH